MRPTVLAIAGLAAALAVAMAPAASGRSAYWLNLDELPSYALMDARGSLYRERFPGLAAVASQATFFPNHTTVADTTMSAIPAALTGQRPVGPSPRFDYRRSLFAYLPRGGRVSSVELASSVCLRSPRCTPASPRPVPRLAGINLSSPGFAPAVGPPDHARGVTRSAGMIASVSRRDTFWFNHLLLPHLPWRYLPNGDQYDFTEEVPGMFNADMWGPQEAIVRQGEQRMLLQMQMADRMILALRDRLRRRGQWNSSLVIITADHGASYRPAVGRRRLTAANFSDIANVPLVVKFPGQRRARASGALTTTLDLMPTVLRSLGARVPAGLEGRPLQEPAGRTGFTTRVGWQAGSARSFTLGEMRAARRQSLAALRRRFPRPSPLAGGTGTPPVAGTSAVTARLDNPGALAGARPGSGRLPAAFLSGSLSVPLHARKLLFVVNGRDRAASESYWNGKAARFSVMLPGLRRGANEVQIFIDSPEGWLRVARR